MLLSNQENQEAVKILAQEMKKVSEAVINNAKFDKTLKARVTTKVSTNKYLVQINGQEYTALSNGDLTVGSIYYVTVIQNDYNNLVINVPIATTNTNFSDLEIETEMIEI